MAGLLKDSTARRIILHQSFSFFAPDYIAAELFRHKPYLMKKAGILKGDLNLVLQTLPDQVTLVPVEDFEQEYGHAMRVMKTVYENDAPFLAVGLAPGIGCIRTEDRHVLRQDLLNVCSTRDLIGMI